VPSRVLFVDLSTSLKALEETVYCASTSAQAPKTVRAKMVFMMVD